MPGLSSVLLAAIVTLVLAVVAYFALRSGPLCVVRSAVLAVAALGAAAIGCTLHSSEVRPQKRSTATPAPPTGGAIDSPEPVAPVPLKPFHRARLTPEERAAAERELGIRGTQPALFLGTDAPGLPYRRGSYEQRLSLHVGQRKLLLTEIAFLAMCSRPGDIVVYAGSAPGTHIPFLAELFDKLRFVLYDPREFDMSRARGRELDRIELHQALFTDDVARSFAGQDNVLFISDIRTGSTGPTQEDDEAFERAVEENMTMQMRWCQLMRPRKASLKFRLPYRGGRTRYFAGQILIQPWAPDNSSETRLIAGPDFDDSTEYDADLYNAQMYYINAILRQWKFYAHGVPVDRAKGMDHCFDCALEAAIWRLYLGASEKDAATHKNGSDDTYNKGPEVARLVAATTQHLRRPLLVPPHGKMVDAGADKRRDVLLGPSSRYNKRVRFSDGGGLGPGPDSDLDGSAKI